MTEFWWSSGSKKKKISWVAWHKLCRKKEDGGLGFHDITRFNQALLCKQAYRILEKLESLLSQILKHHYFKNRCFLESALGRCLSYAWSNILHGKDLLKRGLVKSISNGTDTLVWAENWIMDGVPRIPLNLPGIVDFTLKVYDLLDPSTCRCNELQIRQLFVIQDANYILWLKVFPWSRTCLFGAFQNMVVIYRKVVIGYWMLIRFIKRFWTLFYPPWIISYGPVSRK